MAEIWVAAVGIGLTAASMVVQNQAAKKSEKLANDTAQRNANLDIANAQQLGMDTAANLQQERRDADIYTSHQATSYAASGVLADTGSPLAVQASTVGRLQQRIQQEYINSGQKQQQLYSNAKAGIAYGDAQSQAINTENTAALLKGGASMLSTAYGAYNSGMFSGGGAATPAATSGLSFHY